MSKQNAKRPPARHRRNSPPLAAWLLVGGGLLLLALVAVLAWPKAPKAQIEVDGAPKLKVDQDKVDLGDVPLGQTVDVSFRLTNIGDQPLRIAQAPFVEVVEGC